MEGSRGVNPAGRLAELLLPEQLSGPSADQQLWCPQVLLPFTASQKAAERQRAVGRIVWLSRLLCSSSLLEVTGWLQAVGNPTLRQAQAGGEGTWLDVLLGTGRPAGAEGGAPSAVEA